MTPEDEDAALRARMEALRNNIRAQTPAPRPDKPSAAQKADGSGAQMSLALKAGSEFVAAVLVGGAIGWGLDWIFHGKPLFTILFFLLGVAAGVVNVIRATTPKANNFVRDSRLSGAGVEDKDVPRVSPGGAEDNKE